MKVDFQKYTIHPMLDDNHSSFIDLYNRLKVASKEEFPPLFEQLLNETREHFKEEESLMEQYNLSSKREHKDEHDRTLAELEHFNTRVQKGLVFFGVSYVNEKLLDWFETHLQTMDNDLAYQLSKS